MPYSEMDVDKKRISIIDATSVEDEADVFEISDFTTASEWERFVARLEEVLHEWKLVNHEPRPPALKDQYAHGTWAEKAEEIVFADFRFTFTYLYLKTAESPMTSDPSCNKKMVNEEDVDDEHKSPTVFFDLMNFENDFPSRAHYLCRWYGLQEMCTLSPVSERQCIESESRAKILLSSAAVAFGNSNCSIPVFVQLSQKPRRLFTGTCVSRGGASIEFEMCHLRRFPAQFCHLAGLLDVFKSKLGCVYISMPPVSVAVRFTYVLQDWIHSAWPQLPPDFSSFCDGEVGYGDIGFLPLGACRDPISELHLSCTWPCLSEDVIVENSRYSDLDPLQAPQWTVCLQMTEDPQCLLGEYLRDFLKMADRLETTEDVLRKILPESVAANDKQAAEISQALHRLTEPVPTLSSIPTLGKVVASASKITTLTPENAPIPEKLLDKILYFLFPDAQGSSRASSPKHDDTRQGGALSSSVSTPDNEHAPDLDPARQEVMKEILSELNKQMKSAPTDGLVHKLGLALCNVNHSHGAILGIVHLWQELILEMRFRWENSHLISGVEKGPPNMGSCLLHQKLQMLNCCIEFKNKRESQASGYGPGSVNVVNQSFESNDSRDRGDEGIGGSDSNGDDDVIVDDGDDNDNDDGDDAVDGARGGGSDEDEDEFFECDDEDEDNDSPDHKEKNVEDKNENKTKTITGKANSCDDDDDENSGKEVKDSVTRRNRKGKSSHKDRPRSRAGSFQFHDTLPHKPEGRRVPMKNVFLLASGEQMFIPFTQEPSPMTEDMLEEQAEVLAKLGTSAQGSQIRARMQSACLVSDMESFKAANPGCLLEDFVRWYSPRDYVTEEELEMAESSGVEADIGSGVEASASSPKSSSRRGRLSQRMQIPGNMWVEAWHSAKPVPARRQKRLFDDTKEAEKVFHYLTSLSPAEVVLHVMPSVIHATIGKLVRESVGAGVPNIKSLTDQITARAVKVTRNFPLDKKKYLDLLRLIEMAEILTARTKSLRSKFAHDFNLLNLNQEGKEEEVETFVTNLLTQPEVSVKGGAHGPAGAIVHKMFLAAQRSHNMILDDAADDGTDPFQQEVGASTNSRGSSRKNSATPSVSSMTSDPPQSGSTPSCPDFPAPSAREYILRAMVPRPAPYSKVLPQRMYCLLTDGDNRLAGAFTSDSTFQ